MNDIMIESIKVSFIYTILLFVIHYIWHNIALNTNMKVFKVIYNIYNSLYYLILLMLLL
jgi:hypothetical protein